MSESRNNATDLDVAEATTCPKCGSSKAHITVFPLSAKQPKVVCPKQSNNKECTATQTEILAELKAIRGLLEGNGRPLLVEVAS